MVVEIAVVVVIVAVEEEGDPIHPLPRKGKLRSPRERRARKKIGTKAWTLRSTSKSGSCLRAKTSSASSRQQSLKTISGSRKLLIIGQVDPLISVCGISSETAQNALGGSPVSGVT